MVFSQAAVNSNSRKKRDLGVKIFNRNSFE